MGLKRHRTRESPGELVLGCGLGASTFWKHPPPAPSTFSLPRSSWHRRSGYHTWKYQHRVQNKFESVFAFGQKSSHGSLSSVASKEACR